ncbi:hypothetical protein [Parachlamydia acanthamoebae]|nr:hypothetical protein [Parachlamydia acanthamoebae]
MFNISFKNGLLHHLENDPNNMVFNYVRKAFHTSPLIYKRMLQNKRRILWNKRLSVLPKILATFVKHLVMSKSCSVLSIVKSILPDVTQDDVNAYNARLPIRGERCITITEPTTIEGMEEGRSVGFAFMKFLAVIIQLGIAFKDCYSAICFLKQGGLNVKEAEALETLQYPENLSEDPVLEKFVIHQTGRVPLIPCRPFTGFRLDYFEEAKEDWGNFGSKATNMEFDISAFMAIQKRILELVQEGKFNRKEIFSVLEILDMLPE